MECACLRASCQANWAAQMDKIILLGTDPGERNAPRLALPLSDEAAEELEAGDEYELWSLRAVGIQGVCCLTDQVGALAQARSLLHWHDNHQFCAKCGHEDRDPFGWRSDGIAHACKAMHFPRTDPVVIMLAIHKDENGVERCLLGHHTRFETPMYSTLAGFMEQGETIEAAVRREIFEEAGITIEAVRYAGSQPWPFPSSLMLGCYAEATNREIFVDETELTDARWFTRAEVREMLARGMDSDLPHVPHGFSIASWLIQGWVDGSEPHIRALTEADLEAFKTIRLEALRKEREAFASHYQDWAQLSDQDWLSRLVQSHVHGAFASGEIVGLIGLLPETAIKMRSSRVHRHGLSAQGATGQRPCTGHVGSHSSARTSAWPSPIGAFR